MDSGAFMVEEFINAVSAQLDRVQDALRLKAVNRPLTFALKDFSLDLQVFAEMDGEGNVRFRSAGPNEAGSSTLRLSFTTITRPMIEENTISLAATRSATLDELGLAPEERKRLEQLGVRNAFQLRRLGSETGGSTVSRYSGIPIDRLRMALQMGRPSVSRVTPIVTGGPAGDWGPTSAPGPDLPAQPPQLAPFQPRQPAAGPEQARTGLPGLFGGPLRGRQALGPEGPDVTRLAVPGAGRRPGLHPSLIQAAESGAGEGREPALSAAWDAAPDDGPAAQDVLAVRPGATHLHLAGANLVGPEGAPVVRLNGQALAVSQADDDQVVVALPLESQGGALEIELHDGQVVRLYVAMTEDTPPAGPPAAYDRWLRH